MDSDNDNDPLPKKKRRKRGSENIGRKSRQSNAKANRRNDIRLSDTQESREQRLASERERL